MVKVILIISVNDEGMTGSVPSDVSSRYKDGMAFKQVIVENLFPFVHLLRFCTHTSGIRIAVLSKHDRNVINIGTSGSWHEIAP